MVLKFMILIPSFIFIPSLSRRSAISVGVEK